MAATNSKFLIPFLFTIYFGSIDQCTGSYDGQLCARKVHEKKEYLLISYAEDWYYYIANVRILLYVFTIIGSILYAINPNIDEFGNSSVKHKRVTLVIGYCLCSCIADMSISSNDQFKIYSDIRIYFPFLLLAFSFLFLLNFHSTLVRSKAYGDMHCGWLILFAIFMSIALFYIIIICALYFSSICLSNMLITYYPILMSIYAWAVAIAIFCPLFVVWCFVEICCFGQDFHNEAKWEMKHKCANQFFYALSLALEISWIGYFYEPKHLWVINCFLVCSAIQGVVFSGHVLISYSMKLCEPSNRDYEELNQPLLRVIPTIEQRD